MYDDDEDDDDDIHNTSKSSNLNTGISEKLEDHTLDRRCVSCMSS